MILSLIGAAATLGVGYYVYHEWTKPALAKADAAAKKIESVVASETKKIETAIASEVATLEAMAKATRSKVTALLNSGHVAGTATETALISTENHLANAVGSVIGEHPAA